MTQVTRIEGQHINASFVNHFAVCYVGFREGNNFVMMGYDMRGMEKGVAVIDKQADLAEKWGLIGLTQVKWSQNKNKKMVVDWTKPVFVNFKKVYLIEKCEFGTFVMFGRDANGQERGLFVKEEPLIILARGGNFGK